MTHIRSMFGTLFGGTKYNGPRPRWHNLYGFRTASENIGAFSDESFGESLVEGL